MAQSNEPLNPLENPLADKIGGPGGHGVATEPWWANLLNPKWIALFVVLSCLLPGIVYGYSRFGAASGAGEDCLGEVSIGEFRFSADENERSRVVAASFHVHLALIPETAALGRARLASHKFRVQQGVEQLLRQAHGGDFENPSLGDLKRQLQEQINETLGIRAVADVVVTDLNLELSEADPASKPSGQVAGTLPWND
ncbi:MAG: hypothetical protein RBS80_11075 [Thermoguttaceae bacterium]|jgi:flagellar basal body-associated protein FliL|nr:hypothetical protein [Thermoguttaceae bacterium]